MTVETIKDILDWTRGLHQQLSDVCDQLAADIGDERTAMLLTYIAEHERMLAHSIARFEQDKSVNMMDTWFQEYLEKVPFRQNIAALNGFKPASSEDVLEATVAAHQAFINLFVEFAVLAKTERLRALFHNLADLEKNELMRMMSSAQRMSEI